MAARLPFVVTAVFHYLGPAFAVLLFVRVDVLGVAWLRIVTAALVFTAWRRPWLDWRHVDRLIALGVVLALMNTAFYLAIDRLPLSTVGAIEFLPVIVLAALGARTKRNAVALALAVPGVYLLTDVRLAGEPLGVALAFANAPVRALHRAGPPRRAATGLRRHRRPGRRDADRRCRGHATGRLGRCPAPSPTRSRWWRASAWRHLQLCHPLRRRPDRDARGLEPRAYALMVSLLPATATSSA